MEKYAIFLDFDGTLSQNNTVSEENCEALREVQNLGHYIFVNTGRNHQGIEPVASKYHNFSGYVSGLGSYIIVDNAVIHKKFFPGNMVRNTVEWFLKKNITGVVASVKRGYVVKRADTENFYCPCFIVKRTDIAS